MARLFSNERNLLLETDQYFIYLNHVCFGQREKEGRGIHKSSGYTVPSKSTNNYGSIKIHVKASYCTIFGLKTKPLTLYQTSNFVLDQIQSNCRLQINVSKIVISVLDRVKNIVGKWENAGYQHFSFSRNVF